MAEHMLALLGAGAMGSAVLEAVLRAGIVTPERARITTLDEAAAGRWRERGVVVAPDNAAAADGADLVVVAVKPPDVPGVLDDIAPALGADALVVSLAAGVAAGDAVAASAGGGGHRAGHAEHARAAR
ncbi:pyrroline-5-carboxylate reductase family protein [Piscicoccus intestinalis]|uniref:pyrroline-5-carboxylate reductase family protein n=1 Tax=Piscicoccus intestinalis TaxID=746033 RepID=UPI00278C70BD|nr:NAD(P)-binding domain-containing protein [Piscicoccus intestinalis]